MCVFEEIEEMRNKPILPNEIWLMINEFRKIEFQKRIYNFEVEHGGILRYRYVLNLRLHLGRYINSCYSIMHKIDISDYETRHSIPPDSESEDELEDYPWNQYM